MRGGGAERRLEAPAEEARNGSITETRLSVLLNALADRTDTGTNVRSEFRRGCSQRRPSTTVRKLSVIAASETSLNVTSNARHTFFTSSRETAPRCSVANW